MNLELFDNVVTLMGLTCDNIKDFKSVWYALSTNIIEGWIPSTSDVLELKNKITAISKKYE